jgi:hypothetical protein
MAEAEDQPAAFSHPRRVADPHDGGKRKRLANQPNFVWSTCANSKDLIDNVLPLVLAGVVAAALKYGAEISGDDHTWLVAHKGKFMKHMHPQSQAWSKILRTAKYKKLVTEPRIKLAVLNNLNIVVQESPRFPTSNLSAGYINNRENWLAQFWNFLAILGDYDSMLILMQKPFENCPSVKFSSLLSFVLHKFNAPLHPLEDKWSGGEPVLDLRGNRVRSEGSVYSYVPFATLIAALDSLHQRCAKEGELHMQTAFCDDCHAIYHSESSPLTDSVAYYTPCASHTDSTCRYICKGNPYSTSCSLVKSLTEYLHKESARRQYQPKSKDPLLRSDVLDIHSYVQACQFKTWDFGNFTMMLGGIYYAGRFDSYSEVKLEDFSKVCGHFSIHNYFIRNFAQQVFGKRDKMWHTYLLYFDDYCPQLCYLRHLFVFAHCSLPEAAAEASHLFPDKKTLISRQEANAEPASFTGDADYHEGLQWLKKRVKENIHSPVELDVGSHSFRHTFYLWGILSGTDVRTLKKNARHNSDEMVEKYIGNAEVIKKKLQENPALWSKQKIGPPMENLVVVGKGNQTLRLDQMSATNNNAQNLQEAAKIFVEHMLGVPPNDPRYRDAPLLMELSYEKSFASGPTPHQNLSAAIGSLVERADQAKMWSAVSVYISQSGGNNQTPSAARGAGSSGTRQPPSWPRTASRPRQPVPMVGAVLAPGQSTAPAPVHGGLPGGQPLPHGDPPPPRRTPTPTTRFDFHKIKQLQSPPGMYELALTLHKFGSLKKVDQSKFLYLVVQDVLTLGRNDSTFCTFSEPATAMTIQEKGNFLAAQQYKRGKQSFACRSAFSRFVDPFFECLHACCNGDLAVFQEKYSHKEFKFSSFKKDIQCAGDFCRGKLLKEWAS